MSKSIQLLSKSDFTRRNFVTTMGSLVLGTACGGGIDLTGSREEIKYEDSGTNQQMLTEKQYWNINQ